MRKIALPCYSLRWRLRLVRKACAHSLSLLELAVAVKHVKWDLLLLLLLLLSVVPHVAAQTSTYTVSTKPAVCQAIENCYLFNNHAGNNGEGSVSWTYNRTRPCSKSSATASPIRRWSAPGRCSR